MKITKRVKKMLEAAPNRFNLKLGDAVGFCKSNATAKFDETIEIALNLGVDPKHADQVVRGVVSLPHGTGKTVRVLVLAPEDKMEEARQAGADHVGFQDYLAKIKEGWTDIDVIIATPDMMKHLGQLGKVLGPRGLMPNPKSGTVTQDVAKAVKEVKAGKIDFRTDKKGVVHCGVGKASFTEEQLRENILTLIKRVNQLKPAVAKGTYMKKITISSTMGLGFDVDRSDVSAQIG